MRQLILMTLSAVVLAQPRFSSVDNVGSNFVVSMIKGVNQQWGGAVSITIDHDNASTTSASSQLRSSPTSKPESTLATVSHTQSDGTISATDSTMSTGNGGGGNYMVTVDKWRNKMQLGALSQDSQLEGNALKTAQDGNGQMVHELNSGTLAQVLAPGGPDEFENVFVGGWLCEMPGLTGLDGICGSMSQGWSYGGQTGHAEILSSSQYSKIGCALANGIWACDLA